MKCTKCGYQENITRRCPYCRTVTMEEQALTEDVVEGIMGDIEKRAENNEIDVRNWRVFDAVLREILIQLVKGKEDE